jgi:hypothetical protein
MGASTVAIGWSRRTGGSNAVVMGAGSSRAQAPRVQESNLRVGMLAGRH